MAELISTCETADEYSKAIGTLESGEHKIVLARYGAGILDFASRTFPGVDLNNIFAQFNKREPGGRGPHFDVYGKYLDETMPWIGHFTLKSGAATLRATLLPLDLQESYFSRYPNETAAGENAYRARRHFSWIAFEQPGQHTATAEIPPLSGMALPVSANKQYIVHEITPDDDTEPGSFIKLIKPTDDPRLRETLMSDMNYMSFGEYITERLSSAPSTNTAPVFPSESRARRGTKNFFTPRTKIHRSLD